MNGGLWVGLALAIAAVALAMMGCASSGRDAAIQACRQAGYISAVRDADLWYCFKDRLAEPQVVTPR